MTVSEAMKRLAELPPDAVLCYPTDGPVITVTEIEMKKIFGTMMAVVA